MGPKVVLEMKHSLRASGSAVSGLFLYIRLAAAGVSPACFMAVVEEEKPMKGI